MTLFRSTRLIAFMFGPLLAGCRVLPGRADDFAQCWRVNGAIGVGLRAEVRLGDIVHLGQGVEFAHRTGYEYGVEERSSINVDAHMLLYHGEASWGVHGGYYHGNDQVPRCCRCFSILPVLTNPEIRSPLHCADIEIEVMLPIVGFGVGFSPGEFLDFVLGYFGVDLDPPHAKDEDHRPGIPSPIWPGAAPEREKVAPKTSP